MRKVILILLCLWPAMHASAQEKADSIYLSQLIQEIQSRTSLQVYSVAPDTLKVLKTTDYSLDGIRRSVRGTSVQVTVLQDNLFFSQGEPLSTELASFQQNTNPDSKAYLPVVIASNENQIYEVGTQPQSTGQRKSPCKVRCTISAQEPLWEACRFSAENPGIQR